MDLVSYYLNVPIWKNRPWADLYFSYLKDLKMKVTNKYYDKVRYAYKIEFKYREN